MGRRSMNGQRTPLAILTRHFFRTFFRPSFLDDAGEESFKRATIGMLSFIIACGLLLARIYAGKYAGLPQERYHLLLAADQLFVIALAMFFVSAVLAIVAQALFPDELDYRILMALPISRRHVFFAKLAALFAFAGLFVVGVSAAIGLPFTLVSTSRWAEQPFGTRALIQLAVGMSASIFAVAAVMAVQGLIVIATPRAWLRQVSVVAQTALISALVLSIPIIVRLPAAAPVLTARPLWLRAAPPVWFLGLQQWLQGSRDPYFARLAAAAVLGTVLTVGLAVACYLAVYCRFDRVVLRTERASRPSFWTARRSWPMARHPAYEAVERFMAATLRRSGLHQLVLAGLSAAGLAMVVNGLVSSSASQQRFWEAAAVEAPLTLMVATVLGLRAALLLPTNLRAAWIFKMTEEGGSRTEQLNAVWHALLRVGVLGPAVLAFPLHAAVFGAPRALGSLAVVVLLGWIFVEITISDWRRIPFTCTVLLAKRPAAHTFLLALLAFGVFVSFGGVFERAAISGPRAWLVVVGVLSAIGAALRWHRLQLWGRVPIEFEDYLPDTIQPLGLR